MIALDAIQDGLCELPSHATLSMEDLQVWADDLDVTVHLAVMVEPYLSKICSGEKFIESRLTKVNVCPFGRASAGDIVLFKKSGGAITAMASVRHVEFEEISGHGEASLMAEKYSEGLGYEPGYVESKHLARFVSLLWLQDVREVPATPLSKRGRQAWVTVRPSGGMMSPPANADDVLF